MILASLICLLIAPLLIPQEIATIVLPITIHPITLANKFLPIVVNSIIRENVSLAG